MLRREAPGTSPGDSSRGFRRTQSLSALETPTTPPRISAFGSSLAGRSKSKQVILRPLDTSWSNSPDQHQNSVAEFQLPHGRETPSKGRSGSTACLTPTSAWRARTLAELETAAVARSGSKELAGVLGQELGAPFGSRPGSRAGSKQREAAGPIILPSLAHTKGLSKEAAALLKNPPESPMKAAPAPIDQLSCSTTAEGPAGELPSPGSSPETAALSSTLEQRKNRLKSIIGDYEQIIQRLRCEDFSNGARFSPTETAHMKTAFMRFRMADSADVHKEDLPSVLGHIGYVLAKDKDVIGKMAAAATNYSTMDFNEFLSFMTAYTEHERSVFKAIFDEFDEDKNGMLEANEIVKCIRSLGYKTALKSTLQESLDLVDLDGDGALNFEELVLLMHVYRVQAGFTQNEVERLSAHFSMHQETEGEAAMPFSSAMSMPMLPGCSKEEVTMPVSHLSSVLVSFFGPAFHAQAQEITEDMFNRVRGLDSDATATSEPPLALGFGEVLAWARKLRDTEYESYRQAYEEADEDGNGLVEVSELLALCSKLGFSLRRDAIEEMFAAVKARGHWHDVGGDALDYEAFVHFMQVLNETDGFTREELKGIQFVFSKFDADCSNSIDSMELSDIMHYLGHSTSIDEVMCMLARVNYKGTGTLELREFIRFMRLHREFEVRLVKETFAEHADEDGMLEREACREALVDVASTKRASLADVKLKPGGLQEHARHEEAIIEALDLPNMELPEEPVDWDAFLKYADEVREKRVKELKRRAGFSDAELGKYRRLFDFEDSDKTGLLGLEQASRIVSLLGFVVHTQEEQRRLVEQIAAARTTVNESGSGPQVPDGLVDFWVLVQLLRELYKKDDKITLDKVARAAHQSRFKAQEVAEFHEVFLGWHERDESRFSNEEAPAQGMAQEVDPVKSLSKGSVVRLLKSLGLVLESQDRSKLDAKLHELSDHEQGNVDFPCFLRLMRWMLDTNFCKVSAVSIGGS